jgi:hypothetical protein
MTDTLFHQSASLESGSAQAGAEATNRESGEGQAGGSKGDTKERRKGRRGAEVEGVEAGAASLSKDEELTGL